MQDIIDLVLSRVGKTKPDSKKAQHSGLIELAKWEGLGPNLPMLLIESSCFLQKQFHRITPTCGADEAPLTSCLVSVGEIFITAIGGYDMEDVSIFGVKLDVGAAIVNAFIDLKFLTIYREGRGPYYLQQLPRWTELSVPIQAGTTRIFRGLEPGCPAPITKSIQSNGRPLIKGRFSLDFEVLEDSTFVEGSNKIQQTPWRINKEVLQGVLSHEWDDEIPDIPKEGNKHLVDRLFEKMKEDPSFTDDYNRERALWETKLSALKRRSKIMDRQTTIGKAMDLSKEEEFYNLIDADYRGRIYYMESYINYQGDDLAKGLLEFGYAQPITDRGLWWLLLHAACCYNADVIDSVSEEVDGQEEIISVDKLSLQERVDWSLDNIDLLDRVATNKLIVEEADKPVMFLAVCLDIHKARKALLNGETHYSYLPLPVDGSSNAAQHAAAINKDIDTAKQVGMVQSSRPVDLYMNVGKEMVKLAPRFFNEREMTPAEIRKNLAKRSTMSRTYSAGRKSISKGMYADCHKNEATEKHGILPTDCFMLAQVAIDAIDSICPANGKLRSYLQSLVNHEIGEWDKEEQKIVSGNGSKNITWSTPSGFPVESNLFIQYSIGHQVSVGGKRINCAGKWDTAIPNKKKHASAIAANYVHSMDSAHMLSVASAIEGNCFGAVHDSFAVHASDVDDLIGVIKDQFIEIYDCDNYYEVIKESILSSDEGFNEPLPTVGDYEMKEELHSCDFFFC